jgi:hypothetical protein
MASGLMLPARPCRSALGPLQVHLVQVRLSTGQQGEAVKVPAMSNIAKVWGLICTRGSYVAAIICARRLP